MISSYILSTLHSGTDIKKKNVFIWACNALVDGEMKNEYYYYY